jgi:hypothetical protein
VSDGLESHSEEVPQEIANLIGATRESVTLALGRLQKVSFTCAVADWWCWIRAGWREKPVRNVGRPSRKRTMRSRIEN